MTNLISFRITNRGYRYFNRVRSTIFPSIQNNDESSIVSAVSNVPKFSFGIIADIQYADSTDAMNFQGTKMRRYRQSLEIFREAIKYWNNKSVKCGVVLGDMIDGKCSSLEQSVLSKRELLDISSQSNSDIHYCFGNHCHYNFNRYELYNYFINSNFEKLPPYINEIDNKYVYPLYYHYIPFQGWRFLFVDSYDISLIGNSNIQNKIEAERLLLINNPNDLSVSGTWFNNLPREKQRWVPYNGGVSTDQLIWISNQLDVAKEKDEKVIIFSHQPIHAPYNPKSLIWNAEEILEICHNKGNVLMWIAGHDHDGSYCVDNKGIHHLIPPAPIECNPGEVAYGSIDVFDNQICFDWFGKLPERSSHPWPIQVNF